MEIIQQCEDFLFKIGASVQYKAINRIQGKSKCSCEVVNLSSLTEFPIQNSQLDGLTDTRFSARVLEGRNAETCGKEHVSGQQGSRM